MNKSINASLYFSIIVILCVSTFIHDILGGSYESRNYLVPFFGIREYESTPRYIYGIVNTILSLIVYGGLGFYFYKASLKIGFKNLWNDDIKRLDSFLIIIFTGTLMGMLFIGYGKLMETKFCIYISLYEYSRFPTAIFKSIIMGISEEIRFKLGIVAVLLVFFPKIVKTEKGLSILFWTTTIISAIVYGIACISTSITGFNRNIFNMYFLEKMIIAFPYTTVFIVCAYFFKKYGLLSAIIIHILTDFIWRVIGKLIEFGRLGPPTIFPG